MGYPDLIRFRALELSRQVFRIGLRKEKQRLASKRQFRLGRVVALINTASLLGRRACGLPLDGKPPPEPERDPFPYSRFMEDLDRVYGPSNIGVTVYQVYKDVTPSL